MVVQYVKEMAYWDVNFLPLWVKARIWKLASARVQICVSWINWHCIKYWNGKSLSYIGDIDLKNSNVVRGEERITMTVLKATVKMLWLLYQCLYSRNRIAHTLFWEFLKMYWSYAIVYHERIGLIAVRVMPGLQSVEQYEKGLFQVQLWSMLITVHLMLKKSRHWTC